MVLGGLRGLKRFGGLKDYGILGVKMVLGLWGSWNFVDLKVFTVLVGLKVLGSLIDRKGHGGLWGHGVLSIFGVFGGILRFIGILKVLGSCGS